MSKFLKYAMLMLALLAIAVSFQSSVAMAEESVDAVDEEVVDEDEEIEVFDDEDDEYYDEVDEDDDEEIELNPAAGISTKFLFPEVTDNKLTLGEVAKVIVVVSNDGADWFHMNEMGGFLHSKYDYEYFIQNYSTINPNVTIGPGQELSLEYQFYPHERLEALEFWFSAYVKYNNSRNYPFKSTFANETIELVHGSTEFDIITLMSYVLGLGIVATFFTFALGANPVPSIAKVASSSSSSAADAAEDDWGTNYRPSNSVRSSRKSKKRSKKQD